MAYLTQFLAPAHLDPMINKMADEVFTVLLFICSPEVWVKVTYDWPTALACAYPYAYVDPIFTSQSCNISISTSTKNELVRFSCAYAYVDPVFSCFHM